MDVGRNPRSLATVTRAQKGKTGEKGGEMSGLPVSMPKERGFDKVTWGRGAAHNKGYDDCFDNGGD